MEQDKWSKIIVHWVNCLTIPNLKVTSSRDLDVRILYQLINHLDNLENGETDDKNHHSNVLTSFLKREYPHFNEHTFLEKLDEEQSVIIASLLLHYSCIKTKDVGVRGAMCQRLSPNDQQAIMFFANSLMKYENITEKNIKDTMIVLPLSEVGSPMPPSGSPGWVGSPATPPGRKSRRSRRLMHLEAALETERFDRTYLQEELRRQEARVQEMEKQHALQVSEITALRGELSSCYNGSYLGGEGGTGGAPGQDGGAAEAQRLRRDLAGLEQELLKVVGDLANMTQDREAMRKKVGEVEKELTGWRARAMEFENMTDAMQAKLDEDKSQMSGLKMELAEKNKMLEEYRQEHQLNESIECDDDTSTLKKALSSSFGVENLGNAVIDVQLKEQIIQNSVLTNQMTELQNERKALDNELKVLAQQYADCRLDYQDLSMSNIELKNEVNITKHELEVSQKEILVKLTEISSLVEQNKCAQDLAKQQENKLCKLNEEMSEKINEINMTNQEKLKLKKDLENSQNIIENRMIELKNNSDLINVLNNSIKILEYNSCTLLKEKESIETEFHNTVEMLTSEKSALESELRNNTESYDKDILEKASQLVQLNAKLEGVLNDKTELQRELCSLEAEKVLYQNQCEEKQSKIDSISKEFDILTNENKSLSDKILNIEKSLTLHLETIESLTMISEKNLVSHAETIETLNEEHSSIVDLKNSKIQSLSDEVNNLKELVIDTENKLIAVEEEKFKHLSEIEKLIQAEKLLENDFTICKDELQICKNELVKSNDLIETKSKEIISLTQKTESLNSHLLQNDKIINELGNTVNDLSKQKMECEDLLEKKDIKILSLVEKLVATETEIALKVDCVTLLETERSNLQQSLSILSEQREQLSAQISSLNNEVVLLNDANFKIQSSNVLLIEKNHNLEQELVQCKNDIHHLSKEIELKDELNANVQKNVSVLSDKMDTLSTKVVSLEESLVLRGDETLAIQNHNNALHSKLDNLETDLESKTSQIITLNENTVNLEENVKSLKSELTNSQEKIKKCNAFSQKLLQEKFTVIEESKLMKRELQDVQTKLAAEVNSAEHISTEKIQLEQSLKFYLAENLQLHEDKSEFLEIIEKNQTIIVNLESELDDFMNEYKNKVSSLTDKECQLEEQISHLKNVIDNEQKNVHTKNLLIDKLSLECDQLKTACAALTSTSIENQEKLQEIVHQQEDKIRNLTQCTTELKNDKDNIQNSLQITNIELKKFQEDLHLKMNEMETLSKQNKSFQNEIIALKEQEDNQNNVLLNKDTVLTNLSYEKFKVEQQLEQKTAQLLSVNDQVELLKNEIIQKENLLDNYETKSEDLKEEVRMAQIEIDKLITEKLDTENLYKSSLEQLNNDLEKKTAEAKVLKEINILTTAEKLELLNSHKTELSQLESFLEKKNNEVEILKDQIDKLTIEKLEVLDLHESNINLLKMDLKNKSSEVEVLKDLNEKITAENLKVKTNLEEITTILEKKTNEIVSLNNLTEKNTVEIVDIQNLHKKSLNKLESVVEIKTNEIQLLKDLNEKITEKNLELKINLEEMTIILETKTSEIRALNNMNEKNKMETNEIQNLHKENLKHLESVLEIKSNEVELIIAEKLDIMNLHQISLNQLENALQTKSTEVDNFKHTIDKITAEKLDVLSIQKINLDQMTSDLQSKTDQIEIFEDQIEKLTKERHEILSVHEANTNQLKIILETKTAEVDMLKNLMEKMTTEKFEELDSYKLNLDTMKDEIESKTAKVQVLKEVNEKLIVENRKVIDKYENNLEQLKSELATKATEVETLNEMVEKLNADKIEFLTINKSNLDQLTRDLETKSTEVESSKDLVEKLTAENINVLTVHKTNLNQLRIDLENKTTEVETLQDMLEKLTAEKIDVTTEHITNFNQMKIDLEKKSTEVQTFKELVEKLTAEKCALTTVHEASLSQLRIALENKTADIEAFKELVEKNEAETLNVLHLHQTNLDQLNCELETKSTQAETFKELVEKLTAEKIDLLTLHETNLNKFRVELENKTADIENFKDVIEKMSLEKLDVLNLHQIILDQLRSDLVIKTTEVEVLKDLNSNFQNKIVTLGVQIQDHQQEIDNFNEKNSCLAQVNQDLSTKLQTFKCLEYEETSLKLRLSNVQHELEKTSKLLSNKNEELLSKTAEVNNQLQEISKLKDVIEDQSTKLKDVEYNLITITNENEILVREKVEMENCIDGVKLTLIGDELLEDRSDIPNAVFEDNSLDFEHALNCNLENTEKTQGINVDSENKKITNLKSKLTQLCNSTEMISKTCAKNILQKDDIILKLSDECSCLKDHINQINTDNGNLQQKLYDVEEDNISQRIDYETQIEQLETLRHSELQDRLELDKKLKIMNTQLEAAKLQISLSQQNEKTLFKIVFSKVQEFSDFMKQNKAYSYKLKSLEDMLSKTWEVVCEAVKRLKSISLPIMRDVFPLSLQVPIMDSLKFLDSEHFDSSKTTSDLLATILSSIDFVDNYVDNLCKVIVSLVQDRITCRDSLGVLQKQNTVLSKECQTYKKKYEETTNEMNSVAEKLSQVELLKEKLAKSLNNSDAISSTTSSSEFHIPPNVEDFIKKINENGSRLKKTLSVQEARTKEIHMLKESLHKLNDSFCDYLGDKIALRDALSAHKDMENEISAMEDDSMRVLNEIVRFSSDMCLFTGNSLLSFKENSESDTVDFCQDLGIENFENQLQNIEIESATIQNSIPKLQASLRQLETKKSTRDIVNIPSCINFEHQGLPVYEQMQILIEKYVLIQQDLSIYENAKISTMQSLKQMQDKNAELSIENNELMNKVSALRKVLKEMESKNNEMMVTNEELKCHKEHGESSLAVEKELQRKTMNENMALRNQVTTLSYKMDELKLKLNSEMDEMKNANERLLVENQKVQAKLASAGDTNQLVTDMRNEYEDKLTRMKQKMKQLYQEQIAVYTEKQKDETAGLEALCKKYSEKINKYETHVNHLMFEQWKVGEKLLNEKKQNDELRKRLEEWSGSHQSLNSITSTVSLPQSRMEMRRNTISARAPSRRPYPSPVKELPSAFKKSHSNKAESGGLHMSDEEGEVFDNTYLTELQAGGCTPRASSTLTGGTLGTHRQLKAAPTDNRLSELQWRNSLCLPHLKSSYPAESQFHRFREEDIKMGGTITLDDSPSVEKPRTKKEAGQTSYHKPGPPTPSKNGGRLSLQGNEREVLPLREQNDMYNTKKATTPSRIKSLFMGNTSKSTSRDENTLGTPKGRRLSIFRKPR